MNPILIFKSLFFLSLIIVLALPSFCQDIYLKIGNNKIALTIDSLSSIADAYEYQNASALQSKSIQFENVPTNNVNTYDEYGASIQIIEDETQFDCMFIDTIQMLYELPFELVVGKEVFRDVKFGYTVVGEGVRVSRAFPNTVLKGMEGSAKLTELLKEAKQGAVIVYAISFNGVETFHTIGIGYMCLFCTLQ